MTAGPVVIIGAGHAGFQLAMSLRQHGFSERIALLNDEGHLPYQRPPLSKAYLKGTGGPDSLMFRPEKFYSDQNIDLISDRAVSIDRGAHKLLLGSGSSLNYGHLVLATGARNRLLDIPNANLDSVRYLRTLDESQSLRDYIAPGQRVIVIGAGFIGLEFAATARAKGLGEIAIYFKHAFPLAVLPLVSYSGPLLADLLTGSFVVENIFQIPGLGVFLVNGSLYE
jgi:3-phenylpropionate/trans-cinnamate dioxygenase ferredoxin reductase subunit